MRPMTACDRGLAPVDSYDGFVDAEPVQNACLLEMGRDAGFWGVTDWMQEGGYSGLHGAEGAGSGDGQRGGRGGAGCAAHSLQNACGLG